METKLEHFDIYLHDKNIFKFVQILVTSSCFIIFDIEGHSNTQKETFLDMIILCTSYVYFLLQCLEIPEYHSLNGLFYLKRIDP